MVNRLTKICLKSLLITKTQFKIKTQHNCMLKRMTTKKQRQYQMLEKKSVNENLVYFWCQFKQNHPTNCFALSSRAKHTNIF